MKNSVIIMCIAGITMLNSMSFAQQISGTFLNLCPDQDYIYTIPVSDGCMASWSAPWGTITPSD